MLFTLIFCCLDLHWSIISDEISVAYTCLAFFAASKEIRPVPHATSTTISDELISDMVLFIIVLIFQFLKCVIIVIWYNEFLFPQLFIFIEFRWFPTHGNSFVLFLTKNITISSPGTEEEHQFPVKRLVRWRKLSHLFFMLCLRIIKVRPQLPALFHKKGDWREVI